MASVGSWWFLVVVSYFLVTLAQAIMVGHQHPHRVMAVAPCPACLDGRLIEHYRARRCRPVIPGGCHCPSRYRCPDDSDDDDDDDDDDGIDGLLPFPTGNLSAVARGRSLAASADEAFCQFGGIRYPIGDIIPTADPCRICICHYLDDGTLGVDCETKIECPATHRANAASASGFMKVIDNGRGGAVRRRQIGAGQKPANQTMPLVLYCYDYYTHDQCCPRQECMPVNPRTGRAVRRRKTCHYAGREYQLGERIKLEAIFGVPNNENQNSLDSDEESNHRKPADLAEKLACLRCLCTKRWNNTVMAVGRNDSQRWIAALAADHVSCRRKSCQLDLEPRFRRGCIPVYHPEKCCPVDFICPRTRQMAARVKGLDYGATMCHFEGRKYPVGSRIYQTKHWAAPCIDCECRIPPEFTCLKRLDCNDQSNNLT